MENTNPTTELEQPIIKYNKYGFANRFNNTIILHEGLKKPEYKALHDWILFHELQHQPGGLTWNDFTHDLADYLSKPPIVQKQYFKFFFSHPGTWLQLSPVFYFNNGLWWDLTRLYFLCFITIFIGVIIWLV